MVIEFVIHEKIHMPNLLKNPTIQINEVCYMAALIIVIILVDYLKTRRNYSKAISATVCKLISFDISKWL
jgi:hypothetical protein